LFSKIDISLTVRRIEKEYVNSGMGRPRYPVRSMLLALMFVHFEALPSIRKLCRRLKRREFARDICEFGESTPDHTTFSKFITRAKPENVEKIFEEFRDQASEMDLIDPDESITVSLDSTFIKAYSRRGRKGGISDRGARVGKTERRNYELGWRVHTVTSMSSRPISYVVRAANVNDKEVAQPLLKQASRTIKRFGKRIGKVIADRQYYSPDVFKTVLELGAFPVIPHPTNVKDPLIDLWETKRFKVKGDPELVMQYRQRLTVERNFKASKLELMMENLRWRGVAKVRMHVALCYSCMYAVAITAHKIGRPDLANSIAAFTY
jgi:transposase